MSNKIKIPFAMQMGAAATLCIVCMLVFMVSSCENEIIDNEDPQTKNIENTSVFLVPLEEFPEWLLTKISGIEKEGGMLSFYSAHIYRTEWEEKIIYLEKNTFQNHLSGTPYYDNGQRMFDISTTGERNYSDELFERFWSSKIEWELIWKIGDGKTIHTSGLAVRHVN